jgi:hypothetical protein
MTDTRNTAIEPRGAWVLHRLLCTHLPDPPDDANERQDALVTKLGPSPSKRQISEARNAMPACGGCHKLFDPIGLGLETYDLVGAWRTMDAGRPIDARGELEGLGAFDGAKPLSALLKKDERLARCFAETMLTYALGRTFHKTNDDRCLVAGVAAQAAGAGFGAGDLIGAVVQSPAFRSQTGEPR